MRMYNNEEYKIIKIILNKSENDNYLSKEELEFVKDFDLSDEALPQIAKLIWKNRNKNNALKLMQKILKDNEIHDYDSVFKELQKVGVTSDSNN